MQDAPRENKLRLLMIYAATHPEKFESDKLAKLMEVTIYICFFLLPFTLYTFVLLYVAYIPPLYVFQLARLPSDDMNAVYNMRFLEGSSDTKKNSIVPFSLKFDVHKVYIYMVL